MDDFEKDLTDLVNKHGLDQASNTPDFIVAKFLRNCAASYVTTMTHRHQWSEQFADGAVVN